MDQLILVDSKDNVLGYAEKEKCHHGKPILHRAFSIFLFNNKGEMLITKRSSLKKTWPGFWSNAVCSHPRKDEETHAAAVRRLEEELGITSSLAYLFKFEYSADYDGEWGEHELDWVFAGKISEEPKADRDEIEDWKFISVEQLRQDVKNRPEKYTPWFKICLERVLESV